MAVQKEKGLKDKEYNKKRKPILRVEANTSDTAEAIEEMIKMKAVLIKHSGTAKRGVLDMYDFCNKNGFFDR